MFMRENRKKNGAPQPEEVAAQESPKQKKARFLLVNESVGASEDWRFTPDLSECGAINEAHYQSGVSGNVYKSAYESHIHNVGPGGDQMGQGTNKLKNR